MFFKTDLKILYFPNSFLFLDIQITIVVKSQRKKTISIILRHNKLLKLANYREGN